MTSLAIRPAAPRKLVRVLSCVAAPFDPAEVHEIAVADVVIEGGDVAVEALHARLFPPIGGDTGIGGTGCTPMDVAAAVWARRSPVALAAYDASTASRVFGVGVTGRLPWISLHKVARRVWPGQDSYDLTPLSRWRAWGGPRGPFTSRLPSGAERDCEMAAGVLVELLRDPALPDVGEAAWLELLMRQAGDDGALLRSVRPRPLDAALITSTLPSPPLREPVYPFDDQREWASVGDEDLRHFARVNVCSEVAKAARAELETRSARS